MSTADYSDILPGGKHWSMTMRKGSLLRLTDIDGGANAGMLFYNPINLTERYNAPDTLKCQSTFKLTAGHCLYSDMGRVFCAIVTDTFGWHDTVCGNTTKASVARKWDEANFQTHRNDRYQNGFDSFAIEAAKYGMQRRDLAANVNWFSRIPVENNGALRFDAVAARPGATIELYFMMDTLVLIHTCPHPLNPASAYPLKPVRIEIVERPAQPDLRPHLHRAENARGFENNRLYGTCNCG